MNAEPYRILITGSRDWRDQDAIREAIRAVVTEFGPDATVDHGDAPGADRLGGSAAAALGLPVEKHPADWVHNGRRAGPIRNQHMVDLRPKVCLAFPLPSSRGTYDCIGRARAAGIPVRIVQAAAATGRPDDPAPTGCGTPCPVHYHLCARPRHRDGRCHADSADGTERCTWDTTGDGDGPLTAHRPERGSTPPAPDRST